jgi:hypothetical protein
MITNIKLHNKALEARALRFLTLFSVLCSLFSVLGCVSLVEKTGRVIDGSAFAEKKTAVYGAPGMELWEMRNKAGARSFIIMLNKYPTIKIRASDVNEQGEFNFVSLDYLGGSPQGWNEFRLELAGGGKLVLNGKTASIFVEHEIEHIQISFARIKRYDTRLSGNEALTNLRNRHERIKVIAEWMNSRETAPKGMVAKSFEKYWRPILFPEIVSKKKRPADWQQADDQWNTAESIRWNKGYTERLFPEELRDIRNSGTMLRDWEEALDWIYNEYEWSLIQEILARETVLTKKK